MENVLVDSRQAQQECLRKTIEQARIIRQRLQPIQDRHGAKVHFRPSSTGIAMVGHLPDRPQRGLSHLSEADITRLQDDFDTVFQAHCQDISQGRPTDEKQLQSWLIGNAFHCGRKMAAINVASRRTWQSVELAFVTDEIFLPTDNNKIGCDILAIRRGFWGGVIPVVMELKTKREMTRLIEQVDSYAKLVDMHADLFAELFSELLGQTIRFSKQAEKWIVWPADPQGDDRREGELAREGIRVVGYTSKDGAKYQFRVGKRV